MNRLPELPGQEADFRALISELAARIADLEASARKAGDRTPALNFSDEKLGIIAMSMYRARLHRAKFFDYALFGEPAWDMLLDLFVHKVQGLRISTTSVCLGANVPQSTGLRYLDALVNQGLVRRYQPPDDRRLLLVELTTEGFKQMRRYISISIPKFEIPLPD